jgi:hypothetical protein
MGWIEERIEQRRVLNERNKAVKDGAESIFCDLWNEIADLTKQAQSKGLEVKTNGSSFERIVLTPPYHGYDKDQNKLIITLDKTKEKIAVSGPFQSLELAIDVREDGVVCLKYDGKKLLIDKAARMILDPFLFPDLQPKAL